jgi:NADPH-dependent curcumin reductase CurA
VPVLRIASVAMTITYTAVRARRRAEGAPVSDDFSFVTGQVPPLGEDRVLVRNLLLSVDPYMRELMARGGWERGFGLEGRAIGRVVESRDPALPPGTLLLHRHGWSTHAVLGPSDPRYVITPAEGVALTAYIGILGGTGLTAYVGLTRIARLRAGEDLFVSAAAGGVGSAAGQIARLLGARRIVGSTGSAEKIAHLTDRLGFDAAFDHHDGDLGAQLAKAAPQGIDVYFDNVGGDHLQAAIGALRERGRVAWCGAVAQYDDLERPPAAPRNLYGVVGKQLRIEGFLVRDHLDVRAEYEAFLTPHLRAGRVVADETVLEGIERVVEAFLGMLRGRNTGKMLVRIAA